MLDLFCGVIGECGDFSNYYVVVVMVLVLVFIAIVVPGPRPGGCSPPQVLVAAGDCVAEGSHSL